MKIVSVALIAAAMFAGAGICFSSCGVTSGGGVPLDSLTLHQAHAMIHHYGDSIVWGRKEGRIRYINVNQAVMEKLSEAAPVMIWMAADTVTHQPLIIYETKGGGKQHWYAQMKGICPPPTTPPCDTTGSGTEFVDL
jgi:hypothetical protein